MTWILTIIALLGTVTNIKKLKICFIFWTITNIGWLIYDINQKLYSRALLDLVQLVLAIIGWFEWNRKEQDE